FNQMQEQLKRLIENRTLMLSAISHDLRTPLTLLRLRAEGVEPPEERDRMLDTIAEMNAMLEAGLSLARDEGENETRRTVDLAALLTSLADDMADAGLPVTLGPVSTATCSCRPQSLRRALSNLIGNAIAYGGSATASLTIKGRTAAFIIEDNGPGIPEAELSRVTQPFYRLEGSRNRDTGGMGLGLAITQAIVQSHGGELRLENRAGGGLRASILLPL
ncbi:MAG: ATP-binding protein, partial [Rhodospirillaceae bacterium]|nr:ATP-binding protein [Rhodospirillaceae bacterium]